MSVDPLANYKHAILDYKTLLFLFRDYKSPKSKITELIKCGSLIKVKRSLYLLGDRYSPSYSRETLANIIYGPSYVSYEFALSFYGIIPERVERVTSACSKRNKIFKTPLGIFTYRYINNKRYSIGIDLKTQKEGNFLIATPEKAIMDLCNTLIIRSIQEAEDYLVKDMRMDINLLKALNKKLLLKIANCYNNLTSKNIMSFIIGEI